MQLTPAQQDYLEAIYHLATNAGGSSAHEGEDRPVRVSDIASHVGTKLPTVTRNVARLCELGLVEHRRRGPVSLTDAGRALGSQLAHRHQDVLQLLTSVLGVNPDLAAREACLLEHGMSGETSQRLHLFLLNWQSMDEPSKRRLRSKGKRGSKQQFTLVGPGAGLGSRQ